MPKEKSKEIEYLYALESVGDFVKFAEHRKGAFVKAIQSYRVIECRRKSGKVLKLQGTKIIRII